jgi:hypothetical protein
LSKIPFPEWRPKRNIRSRYVDSGIVDQDVEMTLLRLNPFKKRPDSMIIGMIVRNSDTHAAVNRFRKSVEHPIVGLTSIN